MQPFLSLMRHPPATVTTPSTVTLLAGGTACDMRLIALLLIGALASFFTLTPALDAPLAAPFALLACTFPCFATGDGFSAFAFASAFAPSTFVFGKSLACRWLARCRR